MYISSDTNVWIDFFEIGHLEHPFRLDYDYFISENTYNDEFKKSPMLKADLIRRGLQLAQVTNDEFHDALMYMNRYTKLSVYDALALAIARQRKWVLLSGDQPLRKAAIQEQVECHGTIWIYDQLKASGKISDAEYGAVINELINAVSNGRCRLPMAELLKRKPL